MINEKKMDKNATKAFLNALAKANDGNTKKKKPQKADKKKK